ncbi:hypothetical protein Y695_04066 [Hydrogenophaga sp. T4]|nr:hypothetical protein Y695_04066 [Hydrogenophaga sp. T4]
MADLPAVHRLVVGQAVHAQRHLPERRRLDAGHVAFGDHVLAIHPRLARHFVDLLLPDAGRVHVGLVRQVHQVVDHEPVVAGDVVQAAAVGKGGVVLPLELRHQRGVGERGVARPDPDETVCFVHREALNGRKRPHALARHRDGLAVAAHGQTVVTADQGIALHLAQRQRRAAVGAEIEHRGHQAGAVAEQGHGLLADAPAERPVGGDLFAAGSDVPGVEGEHVASPEVLRLLHSVC